MGESFAQSLLGEGERQPETVPASRNCAGAGVALLHKALDEELLQQPLHPNLASRPALSTSLDSPQWAYRTDTPIDMLRRKTQ